jgi:hypothetical protein
MKCGELATVCRLVRGRAAPISQAQSNDTACHNTCRIRKETMHRTYRFRYDSCSQ